MKALDIVKVGRRDGLARLRRTGAPGLSGARLPHHPQGREAGGGFGRHWCFKAKWRTQVDAFWDAGIAAGGTR